jgi:DNA-binding PadR family transcriptional regulator
MARKPAAGPASDPELLILASLASGAKHGYAIMNDVGDFGGVTIGPGTLYTAITRLVEKKLIAPVTSTGRQRPYRLTAEGTRVLTAQLAEMRRVANVGLRRLQPVERPLQDSRSRSCHLRSTRFCSWPAGAGRSGGHTRRDSDAEPRPCG